MNNKHIIYKSACIFLGNKFSFRFKNLLTTHYSLLTNKGFSLIELTVSVAIFAIIIVSAGNIFIQISKAQREMLTRQILIDEGRYIMESMIKDIRMGYGFTSVENNTRLNFMRYNGKASFYCLADKDGVCKDNEKYLAKTECETQGECLAKINAQPISSEKTNIKNLEFHIDTKEQPLVTVILTLEPKNYKEIIKPLKLQNTVSQRCLKTAGACAEQ